MSISTKRINKIIIRLDNNYNRLLSIVKKIITQWLDYSNELFGCIWKLKLSY